jgi:antitoxin component YwqK of YwqJK toxin-antitoxin module
MIRIVLLLTFIFFGVRAFGQKIEKENLSKNHQTYWDFNHVQVQSSGKYFVDGMGETTNEHGKWKYFDRLGELQEVRNYYKGMLHGEVVRLYPNGKKEQHGFFKWGRQDSTYIEWYETGDVRVQGYYKEDVPINEWKYYYRDGRLKSVEEPKGEDNYLWEFYLPDSLHTPTVVKGEGEMTTFYTTGKVKEWYNYKNGLKNGPFEELSIYGYLTLKGGFKDGEKDGTWEYFYYTGQPEKVTNYSNGQLNGGYKYFYDNGQLNVEGNYTKGKKDGSWAWYTNTGTRDQSGTFKNDLQDGDWTYWFPTGELSYSAKYKEGLKSGMWSYLYKNGKKFKEGTFDKDLKNGAWKTWYEDGTLLMEGTYLNGKEEGKWNNHWESGDLKNSATFKQGKLEGEWLSFYPNGKQKLIGKYSDNMKVGEWTEHFDNGKVKNVNNYKLLKMKTKMDYGLMKDHVVMESQLHGVSTSYSSKDFRLTEEGNYKEGVKDGEWIAYHPGGKLAAVSSNYKSGKLDGTLKQFDRRGNLMSQVDYKDGLKHGSFIVYDKRGNVMSEKKFANGMQIIEGQTGGQGSFSPGK